MPIPKALSNKIECKICNKVCKGYKGLSSHVNKIHKISAEQYYKSYIAFNNKCLVCDKETNFKSLEYGYHKYCSNKCSNKDPILTKTKIKNRTITYKKNPSILINMRKSRLQTYKENPEIIKRQQEKRVKTLKENPEIMFNIIKKREQTYKDNPKIKERAIKNLSISLRNFYNNININSNSNNSIYYLYLIKSIKNNIVKIGKTNNLQKRLGLLKNHFGEVELVFHIKDNHDTISKLELDLHDHFSAYCKVQPTGSGRTEWFDACIEEEVLELVDNPPPLYIKI